MRRGDRASRFILSYYLRLSCTFYTVQKKISRQLPYTSFTIRILYFIWSMQLTELHLLVYLSSLKRFLTRKKCSDKQHFFVLPQVSLSVEMQTEFESKKYGKNLMWRTGSVSHFSFSWRRLHGFLSSDVRRPAAWRSYRHLEGACCFHLQDSRISCAEKDVKGIGTRRRSRSSERNSVSHYPLHREIWIKIVTIWTECMWLRIASCSGYTVLSFCRHKRLFP